MAEFKSTFCRLREPTRAPLADASPSGEMYALRIGREPLVSRGHACWKILGFLDVHSDDNRSMASVAAAVDSRSADAPLDRWIVGR